MTVAANLGFPRIGARRELKSALESFCSGNIAEAELDETARGAARQALAAAVRLRHQPRAIRRFLALRPCAWTRPACSAPSRPATAGQRDRCRSPPIVGLARGMRGRSRCAGAGDDQVVRHQLPLPGAAPVPHAALQPDREPRPDAVEGSRWRCPSARARCCLARSASCCLAKATDGSDPLDLLLGRAAGLCADPARTGRGGRHVGADR